MPSWDTYTQCPREDCDGEVRCYGYYEEGQIYGPPENCYPSEGEENCDKCDTCGCDDWTNKEISDMNDDSKYIAKRDSTETGPDE